MHGIHTHYDNLRVGRNAPPKIIREAYKKLSRQYHPDHNPNNPEATRAMQVINLAYDVLSDPVKRKEHDEWIARMEDERQEVQSSSYEEVFKHPERAGFRFDRKGFFSFEQIYGRHANIEQQKNPFSSSIDKKAVGEHIVKHWFWYVLTIAMVVGFSYHTYSRSTYSPFMTSHEQYQVRTKQPHGMPPQSVRDKDMVAHADKSINQLPNEVQYMRPATAPNGESWPVIASYLSGYSQADLNGLSSVTIENDLNDSDVLVKLFDLKSGMALRVFYIPAQESFKLEKLPSGIYDIRFLDLKNGMLSRMEPFELQDVTFAHGSRHTVVVMKLNRSKSDPTLNQRLKPEDF